VIILDTNVISEITKDHIDPFVGAWPLLVEMDQQYLCAPFVAELQFGDVRFKALTGSDLYGRKLEQIMKGPFLGKVLPMDVKSAMFAGKSAQIVKRQAGR
jgi:predicted nucleic acid-binding protein